MEIDRINFAKQIKTLTKSLMDPMQELPEFVKHSYNYIDDKVSEIYLQLSYTYSSLDAFGVDCETISYNLLILSNKFLEKVDYVAEQKAKEDKEKIHQYNEYVTSEALRALYLKYVEEKHYGKFNALRQSTLKNLCPE